jgi:glycosyltransferase involved in cell wall biosynthesis
MTNDPSSPGPLGSLQACDAPMPPALSIVVLCYGAEERVEALVAEIQALARTLLRDWQVVLVGNYFLGSNDCTQHVVRRLALGSPTVTAIAEPKKGMMGWDARMGMAGARGDYICLVDGDGQFPVESIFRCYLTAVKHDLDLAMTYRASRSDGPLRFVLSTVYNAMFRLLFPGLGCRDVNSKPKVIRRSAYERMELRSDDWFVDAEIMLNVRRLGLRFEQIPTVFSKLEGRRSFIRFGTVVEFLVNLARHRVREFRR